MARWIPLSLGSLLLVASGPVAAQQLDSGQVMQAAAASGAASALPPDTFSGGLGFGLIDGDVFATLALRLNFDRENWGVGFAVPLRLRLIDNDPKESQKDFFGILRREDWDEPSDFLRVIRYVYIGQADKKGPFYVRLGELDGLTVGHGTIVNRYYNGFDIDRWRIGTNVAINIGAFGGEAVVGDVAHPTDDMALAGLRFTVRPLELALGDGWLTDKLVFGASLMTDPSAPKLLKHGPDPMDPTKTIVLLDSNGHQLVDSRRALVVAGLDVGIELLDGAPLSITPYTDLNKISEVSNGWGLHMGILWSLRFPLVIDTLTADIRTEYRRVSGDYIGPYFDTAHEVERFEYPPGSGVTKLEHLINNAGVPGRNGLYFDILAGLPKFAFIGGEYINYDGASNDGSLRLSLQVPALSFLKLSAFYYRIGVGPLSDLFKLDDRSAIVANASIPLYGIFSLDLRWWRLWKADPATGEYHAADDWSVGLGFALELLMQALRFDISIPRYLLGLSVGKLTDWVLFGAPSGLSLDALADPALPGPEWVRLEVISCGICGSDLGVLTFKNSPALEPFTSFPAVLGHEVLAKVIEVGSGVTRVKIGDRVAVDPSISCLVRGRAPAEQCASCAGGLPATCGFAGEAGGPSPNGDAPLARGFLLGANRDLPGGFGERMIAHQSQLHPVLAELDADVAGLIEPLSIGVHAALVAKPDPDRAVLVIGSGPIALGMIWALRATGHRGPIIAQIKRQNEAQLAILFGATTTVEPGVQARDALLKGGAAAYKPIVGPEVFAGGGFPWIFDCVGSKQSLDQSLRFVAPRGKIVLLGCAGEIKNLDFTFLWAREVQLIGFVCYGAELWHGERLHTFEVTQRLLRTSQAPISKLVTHRFPLARYRQALTAATHRRESGALKVLLLPQASG